MIEAIFSPKTARQRPWHAFIASIVFTVAAFLLVLQIGATNAEGAGLGLLFISFITIAATPFFLNLFKMEECEEKKAPRNLFQRHRDVIEVCAFFFVAVIIASSLIHIIAPKTSETVFYDQKNDLVSRGIISGNALGGLDFANILFNNLKVMALIFVFSFVFGAGAIFILSWNASVIGVLIAKIAENPGQFGAITVVPGNAFANYFFALPFTFFRLLPHGFFEFLGYFIAAVAGGIFSVAIIREKLTANKEFVLMDITKYMAIATICVAIGAAIEVL